MLRLAQETGRGGRSYRLPVGDLFTPGGGALTRRAGGQPGKRGAGSTSRRSGRGAEEGRTAGLSAAKVPRLQRSWKGLAKDAQHSFVFVVGLGRVCFSNFLTYTVLLLSPPPPLHTHTHTHTHTLTYTLTHSPAVLSALKFLKPRLGSPPRRRGCADVLLGIAALRGGCLRAFCPGAGLLPLLSPGNDSVAGSSCILWVCLGPQLHK